VRRVVSGRRNCIHSSSAQIDRCNPIGPVSEAEEMFELPPNLWARSGPMGGMRTEDRRRDGLNGGGYAPLEVEAFCGSYPAIVPRSFSLAASLSGPRQRRYRLEELCRSRREDRENLL